MELRGDAGGGTEPGEPPAGGPAADAEGDPR
jgi:hypothetical protein